MSNEIVGIESLAYVTKELHTATDVDLVLDLNFFIMDVELDVLVFYMNGCDQLHVDLLVVIQMHLMF